MDTRLPLLVRIGIQNSKTLLISPTSRTTLQSSVNRQTLRLNSVKLLAIFHLFSYSGHPWSPLLLGDFLKHRSDLVHAPATFYKFFYRFRFVRFSNPQYPRPSTLCFGVQLPRAKYQDIEYLRIHGPPMLAELKSLGNIPKLDFPTSTASRCQISAARTGRPDSGLTMTYTSATPE
jgi:hypothetical protein